MRELAPERRACAWLDRLFCYTAAVEQARAAMAQLPPDQRQRPRLSETDLPQLRAVFQAIREYQSTVAAVQATYGALPSCHTPHQEITYVAIPIPDGRMLLRHLPVYLPVDGQVPGEGVWQIIE